MLIYYRYDRRSSNEGGLRLASQFKYIFMKYYFYILRSTKTNNLYKGYTANLEQRMDQHNFNNTSHTDKTDGPFKLLWSCAFTDKIKAIEFEKYLKSGSGRAFINKHLI